MNLMKEKGVKYGTIMGNTPEAHLAFLEANKDISGESSPYLLYGSFLLYYVVFLCRSDASRTLAR